MELELGLLKLQEFVRKLRASVLGLQLVIEQMLEAVKAKELVHLCDSSHCQRKGSGGFCEDLGLANH
jgi:hypothetical protein